MEKQWKIIKEYLETTYVNRREFMQAMAAVAGFFINHSALDSLNINTAGSEQTPDTVITEVLPPVPIQEQENVQSFFEFSSMDYKAFEEWDRTNSSENYKLGEEVEIEENEEIVISPTKVVGENGFNPLNPEGQAIYESNELVKTVTFKQIGVNAGNEYNFVFGKKDSNGNFIIRSPQSRNLMGGDYHYTVTSQNEILLNTAEVVKTAKALNEMRKFSNSYYRVPPEYLSKVYIGEIPVANAEGYAEYLYGFDQNGMNEVVMRLTNVFHQDNKPFAMVKKLLRLFHEMSHLSEGRWGKSIDYTEAVAKANELEPESLEYRSKIAEYSGSTIEGVDKEITTGHTSMLGLMFNTPLNQLGSTPYELFGAQFVLRRIFSEDGSNQPFSETLLEYINHNNVLLQNKLNVMEIAKFKIPGLLEDNYFKLSCDFVAEAFQSYWDANYQSYWKDFEWHKKLKKKFGDMQSDSSFVRTIDLNSLIDAGYIFKFTPDSRGVYQLNLDVTDTSKVDELNKMIMFASDELEVYMYKESTDSNVKLVQRCGSNPFANVQNGDKLRLVVMRNSIAGDAMDQELSFKNPGIFKWRSLLPLIRGRR